MKKNNKFWRLTVSNYSWLLAMLITAGIIILIMLIKGIIPFGEYTFAMSDCMAQYIPFFSEYRNKLVNGDGILFSWNVGMGTDFFLIFSYYLASPLNLLIVFFKKTEIHLFLSLIIIIKVVMSSGTMAFYLSKREESENLLMNCAFAVSYALSSYFLGFFWNVMWLDALVLFPIIIYGMDKLVKYNKPLIYILSLGYSIFLNYYISYMICIFLCLWFFHYEYKDFKTFIKTGIRFALCSVLAAGLTFVTLYVTFCGMKTFVSSAETFPENRIYSSFFDILKNLYFLSRPIGLSSNRSDANVYAGLFPVVLIFVLPFIKCITKKERIYRIFLIALLILSMNNSVLNYIWHGFHEQNDLPNRFSFIFIFVLLDTAYIVLKEIKNVEKKFLIPALFFSVILPIIIYVFVDFNGVYSSVTTVLLGVVISALYSLILIIYTYVKEKKQIIFSILGVVVLLEIMVNSILTFYNTELYDASYYMTYVDARQKTIEKAKEISGVDKGFYREEISPWIFMDENVYHNIHSVGLFSSTVGADIIESMDALGFNSGIFGFYLYNDSIPLMDDILGIKYVHSYSDIDEKYYKRIYNNENSDILYENEDSLPIGFGMKKEIMDINYFDSYNGSRNQNIAMRLATGINGLYEEIFPEFRFGASSGEVSLSNDSIFIKNISNEELISQQMIYGEFDIKTDGDYYIQFHNYKLDEVSIYINDVNYFYDEKYCGIVRLGDLKQGDVVSFQLVLIPEDISEYGIPIFVSKLNERKLLDINTELSRNVLCVSGYGSNYMKGSFSLDNDQLLFLSIPYNKGWKIEVDGERVAPVKVMGGFMGINAEEGEHNIEIKYCPQGFDIGIMGTVISWIILIGYMIFLKKREIKCSYEESEEN